VKYRSVETFEAEKFIVSQKPWPAGVRETHRLCPCNTCDNRKPHTPYELVVADHPYGGIYISDGEWIKRNPEGTDTVWDEESFLLYYEKV